MEYNSSPISLPHMAGQITHFARATLGVTLRCSACDKISPHTDIVTEEFNALATDSPSWTLVVEISSRHRPTGNRQTMEFPAAAISAAVALFIFFASTAVYSAQDFDIASQLRSKSSNTAGLCANVIEPSGFPCTEHTTRTKDGYVLGLQRVTSHSVAVHKGAPPVLLIHGLFMVIA